MEYDPLACAVCGDDHAGEISNDRWPHEYIPNWEVWGYDGSLTVEDYIGTG